MKRRRLSLVGLLGFAIVLLAFQPASGTAIAAGAALLPDLQGKYYLVQTVDIGHTIKEQDDRDESNNVNWVKIQLFNNARHVRVIR